ncbi:segregation/condensation protein A [Patescibacteria group bacterium]|nr:segregation/condensation protein A [Patescibacteria group bacterium]MBU1705882.1 segregation/condensation protein A [Patescibacteria group bacterium]
MANDFAIKQERFSGPLHLLLELIQKQELPITEISLAQVTEEFLAYVEKQDVPPEELADFLIIATRLLYIKSKAILPLPQEEDEEVSLLADQLKMYQEFVAATKHLEELYAAPTYLFAREKAEAQPSTEFAPPENAGTLELHDAFRRLLKRLEPFFLLQQESMRRVISVQQRINQIHQVIQQRANLAFSDLIKGSKSKIEVVVSFLALLELVKSRLVKAVQKDGFSDIQITHVD